MADHLDFVICNTCTTQYNTSDPAVLNNRCEICNDFRCIVMGPSQSWSSMRKIKEAGHKFKRTKLEDERITTIEVTPKFGLVGQRAILIQTPHGNVLWDMLAYLDQETIDWINSIGGLNGIIISHPHYYCSMNEWLVAFGCPVYAAPEDREWLKNTPAEEKVTFLHEEVTEIVPGVTALKVGGHFPGSFILHWEKHLFHADSFTTTWVAQSAGDRTPDHAEFGFLLSVPAQLPLGPDAIFKIWRMVKPYNFNATHGAIPGWDLYGEDIKERILRSAKAWVKRMGHSNHPLLQETVEFNY